MSGKVRPIRVYLEQRDEVYHVTEEEVLRKKKLKKESKR